MQISSTWKFGQNTDSEGTNDHFLPNLTNVTHFWILTQKFGYISRFLLYGMVPPWEMEPSARRILLLLFSFERYTSARVLSSIIHCLNTISTWLNQRRNLDVILNSSISQINFMYLMDNKTNLIVYYFEYIPTYILLHQSLQFQSEEVCLNILPFYLFVDPINGLANHAAMVTIDMLNPISANLACICSNVSPCCRHVLTSSFNHKGYLRRLG